MTEFKVMEYLRDEGKIIFSSPCFDFDDFPQLAESFVQRIPALVIEKQQDADLYSWLIRIEGQLFLFRSEFYTQSLWLESLSIKESLKTCDSVVAIFSNPLTQL